MKINNINDVVERHLCTGCGACSYLAPDKLQMKDVVSVGIRPELVNGYNTNDLPKSLLDICPGWNVERIYKDKLAIPELRKEWGNVIEVWEAFAVDEKIRHAGSSGGIITAISAYCLKHEKMHGVLSVQADSDLPYKNQSVLSQSEDQLLKSAGSRYAPSSPCNQLEQIENAPAPCAFVGKPCDAVAVHKIRKQNKLLDEKLGVVISFFCAGVPSTEGTLSLIKKVGISQLEQLKSLKYRGDGWPGLWTVKYQNNGKIDKKELTYGKSWGYLQKYRQWRCYICPDHSGEFSDIAIGDPWYRNIEKDEKGSSLIIVRTLLGKQIIENAEKNGYISLVKSDSNMLPLSQPNLITAKGVLWGRILALKLCGIASPNYSGFCLFNRWLFNLTLREKTSSVLGTVKRIYVKKLNIKLNVHDI